MKKLCVLLSALALIASACQPRMTGPHISVEEAWGRPSPEVSPAAAFYAVIKNNGSEADRLVDISSEACGMAELHESLMMDNGPMVMRPVEGGIEVPAHGSVELKPGGFHIMCMEKKVDFAAGDKYNLILVFQESGDIEVEVEIKEQ